MTERRRRSRTGARSNRAATNSAPPNTDYSDIVNRIQDFSEMSSHLSVLFYGRSGTGKTTLACSFPNPLLLDIKEEGTDSVSDISGKGISINSWDEFEQIYWFLQGGKHDFDSVIIDTVTSLSQLAKVEALKREGKDPDAHVAKNTWGAITGLLNSWIMNYRDLPMNTVFLAQDRTTTPNEDAEEEDQIIPEVGPRVSPSVASTLNAAVKVIGQTYIQEVDKRVNGKLVTEIRYRLRVGPHPYYTTKIRNPKRSYTPPFIDDPTYEKLMMVIRGEAKPPKRNQRRNGLDG